MLKYNDNFRERVRVLHDDKGMTYQYIGDVLGLTRQRVYQLATTRCKPPRPKMLGSPYSRLSEQAKLHRKEHTRATRLGVNGKSVRVDKRERPNDICEICGNHSIRLCYHHWDDSKLELGIWVCMFCHHMCEGIEKGLHIKYQELKVVIQNHS